MKIKIVKCSNKENWWYAKLIGKEMTADQKAGGCRAKYIVKSEFNNYTITGWIESGDFEVVK